MIHNRFSVPPIFFQFLSLFGPVIRGADQGPAVSSDLEGESLRWEVRLVHAVFQAGLARRTTAVGGTRAAEEDQAEDETDEKDEENQDRRSPDHYPWVCVCASVCIGVVRDVDYSPNQKGQN